MHFIYVIVCVYVCSLFAPTYLSYSWSLYYETKSLHLNSVFIYIFIILRPLKDAAERTKSKTKTLLNTRLLVLIVELLNWWVCHLTQLAFFPLSFLASNRLDFVNILDLLQSSCPKHQKHTHIHAALLILNNCTALFLSHTLLCLQKLSCFVSIICLTSWYFFHIIALSSFLKTRNSAARILIHPCCWDAASATKRGNLS